MTAIATGCRCINTERGLDNEENLKSRRWHSYKIRHECRFPLLSTLTSTFYESRPTLAAVDCFYKGISRPLQPLSPIELSPVR